MELVVLGSGTAIPHRERGASGYALVQGDEALILECGPGSTRRWPHVGIEVAQVRAVLVTHHHVDHCSDLAAVLFARTVLDCATPLVLAGPAGHARLVATLESLYGSGVADPSGARSVVELADGARVQLGPFGVEAREVLHVAGALGVRVTHADRTFVFSGDSGPCDALVELCRGADLALLECSYPATRETTKHLNARTAAEVAQKAGVSRLVLTHFYPQCDGVDIEGQVRAAGYTGVLELARDGARFHI